MLTELITQLHDKFSEREIIGGLLSDNRGIVNVHDVLKPDHFYDPECAAIYRAVIDTFDHAKPADLQTLANVAGLNVSKLVDIMADTVLGAQRSAAERIVALYHKRQIVKRLAVIGSKIIESSVEELAGQLTDIAISGDLETGSKRVLDADSLMTRVEELQSIRKQDPGLIRGIRTGYVLLDAILRGLRPRRMTVLAAATGFGKSTFAVNLFSNTVRAGARALLISTENDVDDNLDRIAGIITGLDLKDIESGIRSIRITESFSQAFKGKTAFISDNSPRNIHEVIGTITRYVLQHGVELVFVDYIGEISLDGVKNETEEARLARYAQMLVDASRTLNCHIVLLAQLNRTGNGKGRPGKTELQGCFKIAQKAHSLLLFWQTEDGQDVISIDKNRQGPGKKDIAVKFDRYTQRITEQGFYLESEKRVIPVSDTGIQVQPASSFEAGLNLDDSDLPVIDVEVSL